MQYIYLRILNIRMVNMGQRINKYGLKDSDLNEEQKRKIRRDAGYGCVICGALFIQYEHIEPEFHEAKEHDPEKMTLLCGTHHDDVSYKRISKKEVWKAKANPKNKNGDSIKRGLYHQKENAIIEFGGNTLGDMNYQVFDSVITVKGKPVLWFELSSDPDSPIDVCAIFHSRDSSHLAYINRNNFITSVGDYDIKGKGSRIIISENTKNILTINFKGSETLRIERISMSYQNFNIEIRTDGRLRIHNGYSTDTFETCRLGQLRLGYITKTRWLNVGVMKILNLAIQAAICGEEIISYNGTVTGWRIGNLILGKDYLVSGKIESLGNNMKAFDIFGNYISKTTRKKYGNNEYLMISTESNSYDSGEPIWFIPEERKIKYIKESNEFDLGYRLLDNIDAYPFSLTPADANNGIGSWLY